MRGARWRVTSNNVRLNSAIGHITPKDMLAGRQQEIHAERYRKLEKARKQKQIRRRQAVKNEQAQSPGSQGSDEVD
jgi:hypothetical protein